jgi:hypothetical protein
MRSRIEHDVLPDLIADRNDVVLLAEPGQQREVLRSVHGARGVERIVEQNDARLRRKGARQHVLGEAPIRWLEPDEAWNAAGPPHER